MVVHRQFDDHGRFLQQEGPRAELTERIRAMRAEGLTLQAIADTLNSEGVPTLRGGSEWRPSAVQSVTGYERPRRSHRPATLPAIGRRRRTA